MLQFTQNPIGDEQNRKVNVLLLGSGKMYSLYRKIEKYDSIVIFGASDIGKLIFNEVSDFCAETGKSLCFADNSNKKWDTEKGIMMPSDVAEKFPNALWIIASDRYNKSMKEDLHQFNIPDKNIVDKPPPDILFQKRSAEKLKRLTPQAVLWRLDVSIAHHCNLNCAGCGQFSPLVKEPTFAELDVVSRDLERMSYLLRGNLTSLRIFGGEPLLNPQINDFLLVTRKHFPNTKIEIGTNGLLLPKMSKEFWDACRENEASIAVTRYPINIDFDKLRMIADKHKVTFYFYGIDTGKTTWNFAFDPAGGQDPYDSFTNCTLANRCALLRNGKVDTCSLILNIDFFNKAFGTDIKLTPDDYIDIYEAKSGGEILDFISKPVPFCRYCNVRNRTFDNQWRLSEQNIEEWVHLTQPDRQERE